MILTLKFFLIESIDLKRFKIRYDGNWDFLHGSFVSEASALYGFSKELMPNLQIIIGFGSRTSWESKKGFNHFVKSPFSQFFFLGWVVLSFKKIENLL